MGMDVYGRKPTDEAGEYFRANIWWWHPLWTFCCELDRATPPAAISSKVAEQGHYNAGSGLDARGAKRLATKLRANLDLARAVELGKVPEHRNVTVTRSALSALVTEIAAEGEGKLELSPMVNSFSTKFVEEFATFLEHCGGFRIW